MNNIYFARPEFFWLLLVLIPIIVWYILKHNDLSATFKISTLKAFEKKKIGKTKLFRHIVFVIRILLISLLITIIARPQTSSTLETSKAEGIDIVMAIDISSSMLAMDFEPNRLEASKNVAVEFISGRPNDRIGLVAFSGESFTQCPLTTDHATLINLLMELKEGVVEDGTALGLGLSNAVSRLKDSESPSKVVILLTDGVNNSGNVAPLTAADIAATMGVKVYTIGVGNNGYATVPVQTFAGTQYQQVEVQIDENTLQQIAEKTGGQYFRATNEKKLVEIYQEIDRLEKMEIEVQKAIQKKEEFLPFALLAIFLLLIELLIKKTILKTIP